MRKTLSYWYVDGLTELATGSLLAVVGLLTLRGYLQTTRPQLGETE